MKRSSRASRDSPFIRPYGPGSRFSDLPGPWATPKEHTIEQKKAELWRVDREIALEVAAHEAVIRQSYYCSARVETWSVGLTSATGHDVSRYRDNPASLQRCMDIYVWALENYADAVRDAFRGYLLTKNEFTAALSFTWNLGKGALNRASWVRSFKAGDREAAFVQFLNWRSPPEIIGRRKKERDLFFKNQWVNDGTMTEYTRLTANRTPVWSSARKIDVSDEIEFAFGGAEAPVVDHTPDPDAPNAEPTLSPEAEEARENKEKHKEGAKNGILASLVVALIGAAVYAWNYASSFVLNLIGG